MYLWYLSAPFLKAPAPVGVYDHPPDPDVPFLRGRAVDDDLVARLGFQITKLTDKGSELLGKIPLIG